MTKNVRHTILALILLNGREYITVDMLKNEIGVSRNTISTDLAAVTTSVAHTVDAATYNGVTQISSICDGANPLTWVIYRAGNLSIVALAVVGVIALALAFLNRKRIIKAAHAEQN